ncbi:MULTISPECIES: sugar transferase [Blautia]|uniref:sugar transferase n=1 Tax=Blautia TaxID=572511 RepID=UPI000BA46FD6|nr:MULTISPECIES: sugar transferase [Blautia]
MSIDKNLKKFVKFVTVVTTATFVGVSAVAKLKKKDSIYENEPEQKNPFFGKKVVFVSDNNDCENADGEKGHLEATAISDYKQGIYGKYIKRAIDIALSFVGLVALSPVYAGIALVIKIDDPGPVLFIQKRIGQNKQYFKLHKFRSMKMSTPHDVPTHMLENPDQYITRVGKFLRAHSLDELPQIWDIFIGNMSVIGPRPGLWNQDILTAERDKYNANDVKPGLTGWAQINGRDELEIPDKAKLDGEYVKKMGMIMDIKCFLATIISVFKSDGIVEGGTGELKKNLSKAGEQCEAVLQINSQMNNIVRKILITGAGSYIGTSVENYLKQWSEHYQVDTIDMKDSSWKDKDFSGYDTVYHVAGIAHADIGHVSEEQKAFYYEINTNLTIETAKKAKADGVKQFIFMSSAIVYGDSAPIGKKKVITKDTPTAPANFYGDSKVQAEKGILPLQDETFKVVILRPPMIYGKGSKGNYPVLAKFAQKLPIFPYVNNKRSMLYIENLCEFVRLMIENEESGIFWPQNSEYTNTADLVKTIANVHGKKVILVHGFGGALKLASNFVGLVNKAFGSLCYDMKISEYVKNYRVFELKESIERTERE